MVGGGAFTSGEGGIDSSRPNPYCRGSYPPLATQLCCCSQCAFSFSRVRYILKLDPLKIYSHVLPSNNQTPLPNKLTFCRRFPAGGGGSILETASFRLRGGCPTKLSVMVPFTQMRQGGWLLRTRFIFLYFFRRRTRTDSAFDSFRRRDNDRSGEPTRAAAAAAVPRIAAGKQ